LEEAMSLMESKKNNDSLYIDSKFDQTQNWIWTSEKASADSAWEVDFKNGWCFSVSVVGYTMYVRAVRSLQRVNQRGSILSREQVKAMLAKRGFYDNVLNPNAKVASQKYEVIDSLGEKLVIDRTTGLTWQQFGSPNDIPYAGTEKYIRELNNRHFAGYNDWRLPTLGEAMSLMESEKKNGNLYIDSKFDQTQRWIWTADKASADSAWVIYFDRGYCDYGLVIIDLYSVRAVR